MNRLELQEDGVEVKKDEQSSTGLFRQLEQLRESVEKINLVMLNFSHFFEKLKNIIYWRDPRRTVYAVMFVTTSMIFAWGLPLRVIILLVFFKKFYVGERKYLRRVARNELVGRAVIEFIFKKNMPNY
jgi:hypothetical protein